MMFNVAEFNCHWGGRTPRGVAVFDLDHHVGELASRNDLVVVTEVTNLSGEGVRIATPPGFTAYYVPYRSPVSLPARYAKGDVSGPGSIGLMVLSRYDIDVSAFPLPQLHQKDIGRGARLRIDSPLGLLEAFAVHLSSRKPPRTALRQFLSFRSSLPHRNGLLLGDFNMWGTWLTTLLPRWRRAVVGPTWPADRPRHQLDNILTTSDLKSVRSSIGSSVLSDHLAVSAGIVRRS